KSRKSREGKRSKCLKRQQEERKEKHRKRQCRANHEQHHQLSKPCATHDVQHRTQQREISPWGLPCAAPIPLQATEILACSLSHCRSAAWSRRKVNYFCLNSTSS